MSLWQNKPIIQNIDKPMNNTITASINFCFKGQTHEPTIELDLDAFMQRSAQFSEIYMMLAKANDFDLYSYEYEMMQAEEIKFSDAQGLVADFITDGVLNLQAFQAAYSENLILNQLHDVAKEHMQIEDLEQQPELAQALLSAYHLGKQSQS